MKASFSFTPENDSAWIRLDEVPPVEVDEGDFDFTHAPFITARVNDSGTPMYYEILWMSSLVDGSGKPSPPEGYIDPPFTMEIEEAPGRSFTLSELIAWIYTSRSKGITTPPVKP